MIASTILTGHAPQVRRGITLRPKGCLPRLKITALRGSVEIDPVEGDFFARCIELRKTVTDDHDRPEIERERLGRFLKVLANATSYGIFAQFDRKDHDNPKPVDVYTDADFETVPSAVEEPGPYCFPPVAACITGAARLMLALLETSVTGAGGTWAFCDTDSMAIAATETGGLVPCHTHSGETVEALSWAEVDQIIDRFAGLNPPTTRPRCPDRSSRSKTRTTTRQRNDVNCGAGPSPPSATPSTTPTKATCHQDK